MWQTISNYVRQFLEDLLELLEDLVVWVLDGVLGAVASLLEAIPAPEFATSGFGGYVAGLSEISWFLVQSGFPEALAVIGSAYVFRTLRRLLTLGIW